MIRIVARELAKTLVVLVVLIEAVLGVTFSVRYGEDGSLNAQLNKILAGGEGASAFLVGLSGVFFLCALLFALTRRRPDKGVTFAVEKIIAYEREEFATEMQKRLAAERADIETWKSEQIAEMYQTILDQQARGLLPCPRCSEGHHGGHRKSA